MNSNLITLFTSFTLLLVLNLSTLAATIPVASASDIQNASPQPGDVLLMSSTADWSDQDIELSFEGTATDPITLQADGNGQVVLSGGATLQIGGKYIVVDGLTFENCASTEGNDLVKFKTSSAEAEHCRLTNCLFKNNNPSNIETGYKWVSLYGFYNRVDHCWFEGKRHRGTTLVVWLDEDNPVANHHQIDHNYFTRPVYTSGNNEAETIRIGDSKTSLTPSHTVVEYNFFEECDGEIESISNKSCYNVYRYNTFYNNVSILTLRHGHYCSVENNFFFGNNASGGGGVRIIGVGHKVIGNYMQDLAGSGNLRAPIVLMGGVNGYDVNDATNRYVAAQENTVAFNTIVNCKQNIYIGSDKSSSSESYDAPFNNTIDNNLIVNGDDPALEFEYGEIASFNYAGNIYYNTELGKSSDDGFTETNPALSFSTGIDPARLTASSSAIDAAEGTYTLSEDMDGQARSGTYDVGCDEYSSANILRTPIQKTQVGPCWLNPDACGNDPITIDCNGDENGTAAYDNCGVCAGGNTNITPNTSCSQDCHGDWGGSASIDNCGICSGGNSNVEVNECENCDPVKASSDDGNLPSNTLDQDLTTRWSSEGSGEYLEFCFGQTIQLYDVSIAFYKGNERASTFSVEVSTDGINWTTAISQTTSSGNTLDAETYTLPVSLEALKMRIIGYGNSANDWNSITEVAWNVLVTNTTNFTASQKKIYPNPTHGFLHLPQVYSWKLYNTQGEFLLEGESDVIDMQTLKTGSYILNIGHESHLILKN